MSLLATRFAPSPTGLLHLGHAASALLAYEWAKKQGASFHLRIEDIDRTRCKPEFEAAIFEDLHWLGLRWQTPVIRQSDHLANFTAALEKLHDQKVLYRCFLTRREVLSQSLSAPHGPGFIYLGAKTQIPPQQEAELLQQQKPFAWRLSLARAKAVLGNSWEKLHWLETGCGPDGQTGIIQAKPDQLGDVILARKDINTSYHLAVTHDDAAQGITHVIRGQDLFESTHIHVLLQALLKLPTPTYCHHGLLLGADGNRLAKRDGAASLRQLRVSGLNAKDVRKMAQIQVNHP